MTLDQIKGKLRALEARCEKWFGKEPKPKTETTTEGATTDAGAEAEQEIDGAESLEQLSETVASLESRFTKLNTDLAAANTTIATLRTEKTTLEGKVTDLTNQLNAAKGKTTELENTIKDPKGEIAKQVKGHIAAQGLPVDQLPNGLSEAGNADPKAKAEKEYMRLVNEGKSLEAGLFWQANRELLKG